MAHQDSDLGDVTGGGQKTVSRQQQGKDRNGEGLTLVRLLWHKGIMGEKHTHMKEAEETDRQVYQSKTDRFTNQRQTGLPIKGREV